MLGIHEIQVPFAAQFGPSAQGMQHRQMMGDVNDAMKTQADHQRKMQELEARERIAQAARPPRQAASERGPDEIEEIIARLTQQGSGLPFGGSM